MDIFEYINSANPVKVCAVEDKIELSDGKIYYIDQQLGGGGESYVLKVSNEEGTEYALKVAKKPNRLTKSSKTLMNKKFKKEIDIAIEFSGDEFKTNFITYYFHGNIKLKYYKNRKLVTESEHAVHTHPLGHPHA